MNQILTLALLLFTAFGVFGQSNCSKEFKKLQTLSKKDTVTQAEFSTALQLLKALEANNCSDYIIKKNDVESVIAGRTNLFGEICIKNNSGNAVKEYISYMKRHHGSAEEEMSFSFERLFVKRPEDVLLLIGYDKDFLEQLEWGFVNNHHYTEKDRMEVIKNSSANVKPQLTSTNYKAVFYRINPKVKPIYSKYKKAIDYLLNEIGFDLKSIKS